jgi:hypothetical protein
MHAAYRFRSPFVPPFAARGDAQPPSSLWYRRRVVAEAELLAPDVATAVGAVEDPAKVVVALYAIDQESIGGG